MSAQGKQEGKVLHIRLRWQADDDLETVYANQVHIGHGEGEFYLTFGELAMPVLIGPEEAPKELHIRAKVRLAIPPVAMKKIAEVIAENVRRFEEAEGK